jgi:tripartite-type tricarboxylate transporter receptor subunit TctC
MHVRGFRFRRALAGLGAVAVLGLTLQPAFAADSDARAFYRGKQVRFITFGGPGGGYDIFMRTMIPYLEKRLGAKMLPVNEPGAGGLLAMNRASTAAPDGLTVLLTTGEGTVTAKLYGLPGVRYDLRKMVWIARVADEPKVVMLGTGSSFKTFDAVLKRDKPFVWGGTGKTDGNVDFGAIVSHALNLNVKIVAGYKGSQDAILAAGRGEVDGLVLSDVSALRAEKSRAVTVAATLARERSPVFPKVPTVFESARPTPEQARWIDWRAKIAAIGRVVVTTPGSPPDRVALLREAFKDALADPQFRADIEKRNQTVGYADAQTLENLVGEATGMLDAKRTAEVKDIVLRKYYPH